MGGRHCCVSSRRGSGGSGGPTLSGSLLFRHPNSKAAGGGPAALPFVPHTLPRSWAAVVGCRTGEHSCPSPSCGGHSVRPKKHTLRANALKRPFCGYVVWRTDKLTGCRRFRFLRQPSGIIQRRQSTSSLATYDRDWPRSAR